MVKKKIIGLIGARGGSKGVKYKNIVDIGGHPMIAYSIIASKLSKYISRTIVSTEAPRIRDISLRYGAEVPFDRPHQYSTDEAVDKEWIKHALTWLKKNEHYIPDIVVHLRPTTPLREVKEIDNAIAMFMQCPEATSMRSVELMPESPYKMFTQDNGYLKPFVQTETGEFYNLPRQHFPKAYRPNGYVDIIRPSTLNKGTLHGDKILAFVTKKVTELDAEEDLIEARKHYHKNAISSYLREHY